MSRELARSRPLPIVLFVRAMLCKPDAVALCLVVPILIFLILIAFLAASRTVQEVAIRRFHLNGVAFGAWALLQPVPSMYNFENYWDVTFTGSPAQETSEECARAFQGFINHHVFNRVLLQRVSLEQCGLPAHVRFTTTYRGTKVATSYLLTRGPAAHGFIVRPE